MLCTLNLCMHKQHRNFGNHHLSFYRLVKSLIKQNQQESDRIA